MKIIYLIRATSKYGEVSYKIGITGRTGVAKRLREHKTSNPDELEVIYQFQTKYGEVVEHAIQNHYNSSRLNGEWFEIDFLEVDNFLSICEKTERNIGILFSENTYFQNKKGLK